MNSNDSRCNRPYYYTYVLNNPLKFTDPSGYRPVGIFEEESRMTTGSYNSAGSGWDPFGWINNAPGLEPGWVNEAIYAHYVADNMNEMWANPHGGYWNTSMSRPHLFGSKREAFNYAVISNSDITVTAYSGGSLGSQDILYENATTGTATVIKTSFREITGSYYNHKYFISGVKAYGDLDFFMRVIASKADEFSFIPAAYSWEINGSAEGGVASSLSLFGGVLAIRGPDKYTYRSFISSGIGVGAVGVSAQLVKMRYHYFGSIQNFTLNNTFRGTSFDLDVTLGKGIVGGSAVSIMFNSDYPGEFLLGTGNSAGIGYGPKMFSGSVTWQYTEFY